MLATRRDQNQQWCESLASKKVILGLEVTGAAIAVAVLGYYYYERRKRR
jgi:hypothetical protein